MATYKYRAGYRPALKDPQVVGDKLQELRDRNKGLTASIIIDDAKNKNSVYMVLLIGMIHQQHINGDYILLDI